MDFVIKQMAFLSEAIRVFIERIFSRLGTIPPEVQKAWAQFRQLLDHHLYDSIQLLNFANSLFLISPPQTLPSERNEIYQFFMKKEIEHQKTGRSRPNKMQALLTLNQQSPPHLINFPVQEPLQLPIKQFTSPPKNYQLKPQNKPQKIIVESPLPVSSISSSAKNQPTNIHLQLLGLVRKSIKEFQGLEVKIWRDRATSQEPMNRRGTIWDDRRYH